MSSEVITLDKLRESKIYVKSDTLDFKSPKDYIDPFVDIVGDITKEFNIQVSGHSQIGDDEEDRVYTAYPRVLVEAQINDTHLGEAYGSIGLLYGLDTGKPVMKVFSGQRVVACTNLCVFNARNVTVVELLQGTKKIYEDAKNFADEKMKDMEDYKRAVELLKGQEYDRRSLHQKIGHMIEYGLKNKAVGTQPFMAASKDLFNPKSKYFADHGKTDGWNIYNAVTQYISDKSDIVDQPTKTALLNNIFFN